MKVVIAVIIFIVLSCQLGSALKCYSCTGKCEANTNKTCEQGQQCRTLAFVENGKIKDRKMDCVDVKQCNKTDNQTTIQKCCNKDLCNNPRQFIPVNRGLQCYFCDYPCTRYKTINCREGEVCVMKTLPSADIRTHKRGCANTTICGKYTMEYVAKRKFAVMNSCCKGRLCNSAGHLEVPALVFLVAMMVALISRLY